MSEWSEPFIIWLNICPQCFSCFLEQKKSFIWENRSFRKGKIISLDFRFCFWETQYWRISVSSTVESSLYVFSLCNPHGECAVTIPIDQWASRVREVIVLYHIQDLIRDRVYENPGSVMFKFMISNPIVTLRWGGGCLTIINLLRSLFRLTEGTLSYFHLFLFRVNSQLCFCFTVWFKISDSIHKRCI